MKKIYSENFDDTRNKMTALTHNQEMKWDAEYKSLKENRVVNKMSLFGT